MNKLTSYFFLVVAFVFTATLSSSAQALVGIEVGQKAPQITQANPQGQVISLSDYKGKVILIDFWASWCGPCRKENPAVVKAFTMFKDKSFKVGNGFTVFGVSMDASHDAWVQAIQTDGLIWDAHVSDLGGWKNAAAVLYQVRSIPSNFLIGADGVIIAKNLRGEALIQVLNQLSK